MHDQQLRVRVGYHADFPPFSQQGGTGPSGLLIDRVGPQLTKLGAEISWVALELAEQLDSLLDGRVDMLAGIGVTHERSQRVSFISPIVRTGGALFSARGSRTAPGRIATPSAGPLTEATQRAFPECTIVGVGDYAQALAAVVDGHADAAALNLHVGSVMAKRNHDGWFDIPTEPFHVINLAPAFAPDCHVDLKQALDTLIDSTSDQDESR